MGVGREQRETSGQKNVWELRIYLGHDEHDRVKHRSVTFRGGKRATEKELTRLAPQYEGMLVPTPDISVRWSETRTINHALEAWSRNQCDRRIRLNGAWSAALPLPLATSDLPRR